MATYQTGPCNQNKSINRFYNTANTYRRFGIQYCNTEEFELFGLPGTIANPLVPLYADSLPVDAGSSVNVRAYRNKDGTINSLARLEVSYYVIYKGQKGVNSLTVI